MADYKDKFKRDAKLKEFVSFMETMGYSEDLTTTEVKKKWNSLKSAYHVEKAKVLIYMAVICWNQCIAIIWDSRSN